MDPKTTQPVVPAGETVESVKAALAAKELELSQAQHTIIGLKAKKEQVPVAQTVDIDAIKADAVAAAEAKAKSEIESVKAELVGDVLEEELSKVAKTPEEREAIRKEYEGGIVRTGVSRAKIAADLARAALLANSAKITAESEESRRAAAAALAARGGAASGSPTVGGEQVKFTPAEEKWMADTARMTGKSIDEVKAALLKNRAK